MVDLGERLREDEHVHHVDRDRRNDAAWNLEVLAREYHGRLHGLEAVVARTRDATGRFEPGRVEYLEDPETWWSCPRDGAVLGSTASLSFEDAIGQL
jgi:hypothetical protein